RFADRLAVQARPHLSVLLRDPLVSPDVLLEAPQGRDHKGGYRREAYASPERRHVSPRSQCLPAIDGRYTEIYTAFGRKLQEEIGRPETTNPLFMGLFKGPARCCRKSPEPIAVHTKRSLPVLT